MGLTRPPEGVLILPVREQDRGHPAPIWDGMALATCTDPI